MKEKKADPTAPGGEEFDVAGATAEDFDKHFEILERRAKLAGLKPATSAAAVEAPAVATPAEPAPGDITAIKNGEPRHFNPITWDLLGEKHDGYEVAVAKPTDK